MKSSASWLGPAIAVTCCLAHAGPLQAQVDTIARFGGMDDAGGLTTYRPRAAVFAGESVILAQGDGLHRLDLRGSSESIAETGEGPGDVRVPWSIRADAENVRVFDVGLMRLTVFSESGRIVTHSLPDVSLALGRQGYPLGDGSVLSVGSAVLGRSLARRPGAGNQVRRTVDSLVVRKLSPDDGVVVLATYPSTTRFSVGSGSHFAPGHPRTMTSVAGDDLLVANSHRPDFIVLSAETGEERRGSTTREQRPFDPTLHQRLVNAFLARPGLGFAGAAGTDSREAVLEAAGQPTHAPIFDDAVLSQSGDVWLRDIMTDDTSSSTWVVVGRDGQERVVSLPAGVQVLAIDGDRIAGVVRDDLDVATLLVLAVRSP